MKLLIGLLMMIVTTDVMADNSQIIKNYLEEDRRIYSDTCDATYTYSHWIMSQRQNGVPKDLVLAHASDYPMSLKSISDYRLIDEAYAWSIYNDPELKETVVRTFAMHVYLWCVNAYE